MAVKTKSCCFPHAGGDVSRPAFSEIFLRMFSPRRWGCFHGGRPRGDRQLVFPTQVGMFPSSCFLPSDPVGFPHAGGDVSTYNPNHVAPPEFSPRRWGCFQRLHAHGLRYSVFPTQVGMFLGDIVWGEGLVGFSPRRWGCFPRDLVCRRGELVFPTQVGMFPLTFLRATACSCFPHAGGDVSQRVGMKVPEYGFSPRRWGCFPVGEGGA